jgi:hypothetical protein
MDVTVYLYKLYILCVPLILQQLAAGPAQGWSTEIGIVAVSVGLIVYGVP